MRGFSLVETIVAIAITTAGIAAVAQLSAIAVRATYAARLATFSTLLASQKIEQLRSLAWTSDAAGVSVSDTSTNTAVVPEQSTGGRGLSSSPAGSLTANTAEYCDLLDEDGRTLGDCTMAMS